MSSSGIEIEAKFLVKDLGRIETLLHDAGAGQIQDRIYERNLRFDLPDDSLRAGNRVLRLRRDEHAVLTYQGPGTVEDGIRVREELEVIVGDFDMAERILTALGYHVVLMYEKYRRTYKLGGCLVMLDELPYGHFVEIEADDADAIFAMTGRLGLNKEASICDSYQALFDRVRGALGLGFRDLSFKNFERIDVSPALLGVRCAD